MSMAESKYLSYLPPNTLYKLHSLSAEKPFLHDVQEQQYCVRFKRLQ